MMGADGPVAPRLQADAARRLAGSVMLVVVLVVILVVAAIRGHTVPGQPAAQPVESAPQVGDCVLEDPHGPQVNIVELPALRTQPCSGPRYGEVAFVIADFTARTAGRAPGPDLCSEQVGAYVGTPGPPPPDGSFVPFAVVGWTILGPAKRQRAAGQKWAACVVYLPDWADSAPNLTVDHSLQGAWQRPEDSRLFTICLDDIASASPAVCRSPHRFELLGMAVGTPTIPQESLDEACRHIVEQALGSSKGLDSGELGTQVVPVRDGPNGGILITGPDAISADAEYSNLCLATPTDSSKRLIASLRGLGDGAVPLN